MLTRRPPPGGARHRSDHRALVAGLPDEDGESPSVLERYADDLATPRSLRSRGLGTATSSTGSGWVTGHGAGSVLTACG